MWLCHGARLSIWTKIILLPRTIASCRIGRVNESAIFSGLQIEAFRLEHHTFHFVESDLVAPAIIKPGGPCGFMTGHVLDDLQLAAVLQIRCNPGCAEVMDADLCARVGGFGTALDHPMQISLG